MQASARLARSLQQFNGLTPVYNQQLRGFGHPIASPCQKIMAVRPVISSEPITTAKGMWPIGTMPDKLFRSMSSGRNCEPAKMPKCSKENLAKSPCMKKKKKEEKDKKKGKIGFKSLWENPECCVEVCPDVLPRFDALYYKISDKAKRKYMQTWVECPEMKILPRKVCCFEKLKLPPIKRRKPGFKPKTACSMNDEDSDLMKCKKGTTGACPTIKMPCCRSARKPPKCKAARIPTDCKKICAPYPSFSECKKPKLRKLRPVECNCLHVGSMCEVWATLRKRQLQK